MAEEIVFEPFLQGAQRKTIGKYLIITKLSLLPIVSMSLSGRRGSNPRPSAWKADALSTELLPQHYCVGEDGFEPPKV